MCILSRKKKGGRHTKGKLFQQLRRSLAVAGSAQQSEFGANHSPEASCCYSPLTLLPDLPTCALQPSAHSLTLRANTTLKRIMVGASLFGDGSVFETCRRNVILMNESYHVPRNILFSAILQAWEKVPEYTQP